MSKVYLTNLWGVTQTPGGAAGYNGVVPGLDEFFALFPEPSIILTRVSGANPPYMNIPPMINTLPDFYLASSDVYKDDDLAQARKCWRIKFLRGDSRDDYLLIQIQPPIIGQPMGLRAKDIDRVIVVSKSRSNSLLNITSWPVPVYVLYPLIEHPERKDEIHDDEFSLLIWAELYKTWEDALKVSEG